MYKTSLLALSLVSFLMLPCEASTSAGADTDQQKQTPAERKAAGQQSALEKKQAAEEKKRAGKNEPGPAQNSGADDKAPAQKSKSGAGQSEQPPPAPTITGRVIHGSIYGQLAVGEKVAVVDISRVFEVIPAYQKIKREQLKKTKAQYHILIAQANQEFQAAVEAEAVHAGLGLVVEKGGVSGVPVVDITNLVRKRLKN